MHYFKSNSFLAFVCSIFLSITAIADKKYWGKVSFVNRNKNILLRTVYAGISHEVCLFAFTGVDRWDLWGRERKVQFKPPPV